MSSLRGTTYCKEKDVNGYKHHGHARCHRLLVVRVRKRENLICTTTNYFAQKRHKA